MIRLRDESDTARLARLLARWLPRGSVVLLTGPMGAGKTTLVRHLARALGFEGRVTSPTYTLMHTYPTPEGPLLHADVYRLPDPGALLELGLEDALLDARLCLIEWGAPGAIAADLQVALDPVGETARALRLVALEPELESAVAEIGRALRAQPG